MAYDVNTGRQFACKVVDLQAAKADFQAKARARGDEGEEQESKFFAIQHQPLKHITTTNKTPLIEKAILEKIAMQQRESLLLAELSHVSLICQTPAPSRFMKLRECSAKHYHH